MAAGYCTAILWLFIIWPASLLPANGLLSGNGNSYQLWLLLCVLCGLLMTSLLFIVCIIIIYLLTVAYCLLLWLSLHHYIVLTYYNVIISIIYYCVTFNIVQSLCVFIHYSDPINLIDPIPDYSVLLCVCVCGQLSVSGQSIVNGLYLLCQWPSLSNIGPLCGNNWPVCMTILLLAIIVYLLYSINHVYYLC